jgi:hypothetical protein
MVAGPVVPPPPGLFSTTIGWPRCLLASSASSRWWRSVEPPAGHGTMSVIGRDGNACARAAPNGATSAAAAAEARTARRRTPVDRSGREGSAMRTAMGEKA